MSIQQWWATVPALVDEYSSRWRLRTGAPYSGGSCAWVAPATTADGRDAVLKLGWPHPEARAEAAALRHWAGEGAVVLQQSETSERCYALLLERCVPGTCLRDAGVSAGEALAVGADVLRRVWHHEPVDGFDELGDVTTTWAAAVRERMDRHRPPLDSGLVEAGARVLEELPRSAARRVVLHGDFNPGNLLSAAREPWLAIDPKPMAGDPAYDPGPLVLQTGDPLGAVDPVATLRHGFELVAQTAGCHAERAAAWAFARHVEYLLWLVDRGTTEPLDDLAAAAAALAGAAGL